MSSDASAESFAGLVLVGEPPAGVVISAWFWIWQVSPSSGTSTPTSSGVLDENFGMPSGLNEQSYPPPPSDAQTGGQKAGLGSIGEKPTNVSLMVTGPGKSSGPRLWTWMVK